MKSSPKESSEWNVVDKYRVTGGDRRSLRPLHHIDPCNGRLYFGFKAMILSSSFTYKLSVSPQRRCHQFSHPRPSFGPESWTETVTHRLTETRSMNWKVSGRLGRHSVLLFVSTEYPSVIPNVLYS